MILGDIETTPDECSTEGKVFTVLLWIWTVAAVIVLGTPAMAAKEKTPPANGESTLMLVREWDPASGSLTGWLPNHSAAIQLELLDKSLSQHFEPEEAVYIRWPRRPRSEPRTGQILISPTPRTFDGQAWLPVKRDPNVVEIGKGTYLIRRFMLGESKWRLPLGKSATSVGLTTAKSLQ